jgi:hypothetical protein
MLEDTDGGRHRQRQIQWHAPRRPSRSACTCATTPRPCCAVSMPRRGGAGRGQVVRIEHRSDLHIVKYSLVWHFSFLFKRSLCTLGTRRASLSCFVTTPTVSNEKTPLTNRKQPHPQHPQNFSRALSSFSALRRSAFISFRPPSMRPSFSGVCERPSHCNSQPKVGTL